MKKYYFDSFNSDRRTQIVTECTNHIRNGRKVIYILPSREAMFHVRRLFISELGGLFDCYIFGFDDFEKLILDNKISNKSILDDHETAIILESILASSRQNSIFHSVRNKPGFVNGLQTVIRKLKRLDIAPDALIEKSKHMTGIVRDKIESLSEIYSDFEKYKSSKNIFDVDDLSKIAVEYVQNAEIFKQTSVIVVDGFINIDPINIKLLKVVAESFPEINLLANIPFENVNNLEFLEREVIKDLAGLGFDYDNKAESEKQDIEQCISKLAQSLYSQDASIEIQKDCLTISESPCLDHEIRETARNVKTMLIDDNIKPHEIAVICADTKTYKGKMIEIFGEYGIPLQANNSEKLISIPLIKDLLCFLKKGIKECAESGFVVAVSSKYLFPKGILKNTDSESENYFKIAERITKRFKREQYLNAFREAIKKDMENADTSAEVEKYLETIEQFAPENCEGPVEALRKFNELINELNIKEHIEHLHVSGILTSDAWIRDFSALQKFQKSLEYLIETYSKLEECSSEGWFERLIRNLYQVLAVENMGVKTRDTGGVKFIPQDLARGQEYNIVFMLGMNEGLFPSTGRGNIIFDSNETDQLYKLGINLGQSTWELQREKIRFNSCIASARKQLHISYRTTDEDGGQMIPSPFVDEVLSSITQESIQRVKSKPVSMRDRIRYDINPASELEALRKLNSKLWAIKKVDEDCIEHVSKTKESVKVSLRHSSRAAIMELSRELNPSFDQFDGNLSSPKLAQQDAGYGFSASQLNCYVKCPFQYFTERVLDVEEDEDEPLGARTLGTLYHAVLKDYHEGNTNPTEADHQRLKDIFERLASEIDYGNLPSMLVNFIKEEFLKMLSAFIQLDAQNLKRYYEITGLRLQPTMLEQPFKLQFGKDKSLIRGAIDRVDMEVDKDGNYTGRYVIYDYKKSSIKGLKECIEGKDFQLPLYLNGIEETIKNEYKVNNPECIALLYYSIKNLEWKGIIRNDMKSALFDKKKRPQLIDANNMKVLMEWVEGEALKTISNIQQGNFVMPKECPSSFFECKYKGMCRYDRFRMEKKA